MNREAWLNELANRLRPKFEAAGKPLPEKIRISVGFPSVGGLSLRKPVIGQCWYSEASGDNSVEIFISPMIADALKVGDILVHELCHSVLPYSVKHGPAFKKLAHRMGLEGKPTETMATPMLEEELLELIDQYPPLGPYPHAELKPLIVPKTQTTRMRKVECPKCGYTVRVAKKWIANGLPTCPCTTPMEAEEIEESDGEAA